MNKKILFIFSLLIPQLLLAEGFVFFANNTKTLDTLLTNSLTSQQGQFIAFVTSLFVSCAVLWITCQGLLAIAGKIEAPISDVIFKLGALLFILMFATNIDGWLNMAIDFINSIKSLGGATSPYSALDKIFTDTINYCWRIWEPSSMIDGSAILAGLTIASIIIGKSIFLLPLSLSLLMNDFTFKILITVAPLFIFCLSYQPLRGMFNAWLGLVIGNILFFIFLMIVVHITIPMNNLVKLDADTDYFSMIIITCFIGLLGKQLIGLASQLASQLASFSAEGIGASLAIKSGSYVNQKIGKGAVGAAKLTGKGIQKGGKAAKNLYNTGGLKMYQTALKVSNPLKSAADKALRDLLK